jgi:hypothetical protein
MSRNINICNAGDIQPIDGFTTITVDNIDSLVNYSVDIIFYRWMNGLTQNDVNSVLSKMLQKVRVGGSLVLKLIDGKSLAKSYFEGSIDSGEFLDTIASAKILIAPENFSAGLNNNEFMIHDSEIVVGTT